MFALVVPGVGRGRYASPMDPVYIPLLTAIGGGLIGAIVNQWLTHRRTVLADDRAAVADVQAAGMEGVWKIRAESVRLSKLPPDYDLAAEGGVGEDAAPRALLAALGRARLVVTNRAVRAALGGVLNTLDEATKKALQAPVEAPVQSAVTWEYSQDLLKSLTNLTAVSLDKIGPRDRRGLRRFSRSRPKSRQGKKSGHAAGDA